VQNPIMPSPGQPPRFQFGLRWMLLLVAAAAIFLTLTVAAEQFLLRWILTPATIFVIPTVFIIVALHDCGDRRTFAIGALVPTSILIFAGDVGRLSTLVDWLSSTIWLLLMAAGCGAVAIATRRTVAPTGKSNEK
jgi:FtsH-binding integral membrane protein